MGTHPIFESDFDCLTDNHNDGSVIQVSKFRILCANAKKQKFN